MNKLYEEFKIDQALVSQALNDSNATGKYFSMKDFRNGLAVLNGGAMAVTKTSKIELLQAKDADGDASKALSGKEATITANTNVTKLTIALDTVLNGESIIINGLTFTGHTDTTTKSARQFSISGTNTQDADELASCINDADYGVPGVTATNSAGTLTLEATEPGSETITATSTDATFTIATVEAQAYVEFEELDLDTDFTHVAVKVTTTADSVVSATLLRGLAREAIEQEVGASA